VSTIWDVPTAWRDALMPASYNGARFHCEANSRESGRRIVQHQFPKKDLPYAEDMGRGAREFSIRGYCVVFPYDSTVVLYSRDYRRARDILIAQLEKEGPGVLQLPTQPAQQVVCLRYRMTEEQRFGGFCVFDMTFTEYGRDPQLYAPTASTISAIVQRSEALRQQVQRVLEPPPNTGIDI
jgi:prophage DNA circulation protein